LNDLHLPDTHFKSLVPVANPLQYVLLLDQATETPEAIAQQLDSALSHSYHYQRARLMGQLTPPQVLISAQIPEILTLHRVQTGSIWGGIKHPTLATLPIDPALLRKLKAVGEYKR
jgi:hypothetical protein